MSCGGRACQLADGREQYPPMPKQDANIFEILISQMGERRDIYSVLGKASRVLGHAELFEPVRNLLHRGPASGEFAVARLSFWNRTTDRLYDKSPAQYRASGARRSRPTFLIIVNPADADQVKSNGRSVH